MQGAETAPLAVAAVQIGGELFQNGAEFPGHDRFQNKIMDPQFDGLLGIGKFTESRENHHEDGWVVLLEMAGQLQTVHKGHTDIRNHHIGQDGTHAFQGFAAVFAGAGHGEAVAFPVDIVNHAFADDGLVLYQHQFIHRQPASCGSYWFDYIVLWEKMQNLSTGPTGPQTWTHHQ